MACKWIICLVCKFVHVNYFAYFGLWMSVLPIYLINLLPFLFDFKIYVLIGVFECYHLHFVYLPWVILPLSQGAYITSETVGSSISSDKGHHSEPAETSGNSISDLLRHASQLWDPSIALQVSIVTYQPPFRMSDDLARHPIKGH